MTAKGQPKRSLKKELIIKTAEQLFNRHGIKRVTVEEICRTAEVSKMTFYKYFLNKTELIRCLWNVWIDEGLLKLDEIEAQNIPLPEKIQMMFKWKSNFLSNISEEFIKDILPLNLGYERIFQRFNELIINAQKRGEIRSTIKPEFLLTVLNKLYELARDEELRSKYNNLIEFNREFKDFFWYGVISR